jgi:hypothetical protein
LEIEIGELDHWIHNLEDLQYEAESVNKIREHDLLPVFDLMTEMFEEKVEEFIE